MFRGYYSEQARTQFLAAALRGCCGTESWRLLPRRNAGQFHPSDFSLVELRMSNISSCVTSLAAHPLVKSVTPHRKLSRSLRCSDPINKHVHRTMTLLNSVRVCVCVCVCGVCVCDIL